MDFNVKNSNKDTNNKQFLENQLKELDNDFDSLYDRMNKKRKELSNEKNNKIKIENNNSK
jgi:hypothetical protein